MRSLLRLVLSVSLFGSFGSADELSSCFRTLGQWVQEGNPQLAVAKLSTGQSVPFDAGRYATCMNNMGTRSGMRFFLVKFEGTMMNQTIPCGLGFCLPDVCENSDAAALVGQYLTPSDEGHIAPNAAAMQIGNALIPALAMIDRVVTEVPKSSQIDLQHFVEDPVAIMALILIGFMVSVVLVATFLSTRSVKDTRDVEILQEEQLLGDFEQQQRSAPRPQRQRLIVQAWSLFGDSGTLPKLVEIPLCKPTDCLNGLRVISMFWIIMGHSFLMPSGIMGYENPQDWKYTSLNTDAAENNVFFFFLISSQQSVDSFFFLSGFLLSLLTMKELRAKNGKLNILAGAAMRYVRLTPSFALALLLYYKIWPYLVGEGPFAPELQNSISRRCDVSWWSELTYTMNFIPFDSDQVCMGWSWYLGDDMIFFLISMVIFPLYYRSKLVGCLLIALLTAGSFAWTIALVYQHHLSIKFDDYHYEEYSLWAYSKPYHRIPTYFVGVVAAWILEEMEQAGFTRSSRPTGRKAQCISSLLALASFALLIFLLLIPATDHGARSNSWGDFPSMLFITFSRPLWAVGLAVLTLLCYYDYMPLLNGFMSHRFWTPFARLTYGAYLTHPMVIKLAAGGAVQYYTFSGMDMFYRWLGNSVCAYSLSMVLWCLIERPMMTLTSAALKRKSSSPKKKQSQDMGASLQPIPSEAAKE